MDFINKLFNGKGYIEGITIINVEGEILFSAKFNNKLDTKDENYEVVGKKFLDIYENLDESSSTAYIAMQRGMPVYMENQIIKSADREPIEITSLSIPIKSGRTVVGAIDLSVSGNEQQALDGVEIMDEVLFAYNNVESLGHISDEARYRIEDIQTCDSKMLELRDNIVKLAKTDMPVLIYGETGTGKELVAHSLHNAGKREGKPFVVQNCASIPANLMESILFGTSKGAFTGAVDNMGLLELANGGTLFLDEINSMPLELQPKILRVIQDGTFRRVGEKQIKKVDVRIISSTNEKPAKIVAEGRFRMDLYYRLAVMVLEIPPLRERKKDIPLLTNYFISKYNNLFGKNIHKVSKKLYEELGQYQWNGNVRELENTVAYGVGMAEDHADILELRHIESRLHMLDKKTADFEDGDMPLTDLVADYERNIIKNVLQKTEGNITRAAAVLGVPRQTLSRKVKEYQIR
ncbi:Luminescence regulatory protein luxO [uncultured Eubacterium sp.]|nr:Luminescence regulatory protein luxO [uncultured Eubacterium sp.]